VGSYLCIDDLCLFLLDLLLHPHDLLDVRELRRILGAESRLDESLMLGEGDDLIEALDLRLLLTYEFALLAEGNLSDGLLLGVDLGLEIVDLVVEFEDEPAEVVALLAGEFLRFLFDDLLNDCDQILSVQLDGLHALVLFLELLVLFHQAFVVGGEFERLFVHLLLN
jgi:hypothetical protein